KGTQKCIPGELFSGQFIVCHPKRQGINPVAVLLVDLIVLCSAPFHCRSKYSKIADHTQAARHVNLPSLCPVGGSLFYFHRSIAHWIEQSMCPKNADGHQVLQGKLSD